MFKFIKAVAHLVATAVRRSVAAFAAGFAEGRIQKATRKLGPVDPDSSADLDGSASQTEAVSSLIALNGERYGYCWSDGIDGPVSAVPAAAVVAVEVKAFNASPKTAKKTKDKVAKKKDKGITKLPRRPRAVPMGDLGVLAEMAELIRPTAGGRQFRSESNDGFRPENRTQTLLEAYGDEHLCGDELEVPDNPYEDAMMEMEIQARREAELEEWLDGVGLRQKVYSDWDVDHSAWVEAYNSWGNRLQEEMVL